MHLIKVNAINSTNSFGREMFRENSQMPATCIWAEHQLQGRGQRGTQWDSEPGRNLTFSIVFPRPKVSPGYQFMTSAAVATTLVSVLEHYQIPRLKVKWPNDIMSANFKIGGILIENVITEGKVGASVIGIGLNVNQKDFLGLPSAGSMFSVAGREFNREEVLEALLVALEKLLSRLHDGDLETVLENYKRHLFRSGVPSTFELPDKTLFTGMIADVTPGGKLLVRNEDQLLQPFDLKEIRLCY